MVDAEDKAERAVTRRERISVEQLSYRQNVVKRVSDAEARTLAVEALAGMAASRPLKPPGR